MRRSMLFLPGNTPNMLVNGAFLGADAVILDLEDAVAPSEKDAARTISVMTLPPLSICTISICLYYIISF